MNCQKLLSVVALALLIAVTSCKKDKDSGSNSQFSATMGSTAFSASLVSAVSASDFIGVYGSKVMSGDTVFLQLLIPDTAHVNTPVSFAFEGTQLNYFNSPITFAYTSNIFPPSHGTIILSTYDKTNKKIAGTFSGVIYHTLNDSIIVTNGQFNTTYQ